MIHSLGWLSWWRPVSEEIGAFFLSRWLAWARWPVTRSSSMVGTWIGRKLCRSLDSTDDDALGCRFPSWRRRLNSPPLDPRALLGCLPDVVPPWVAVLAWWRFVREDCFVDASVQQKTTLPHLDQAFFFHVEILFILLVSFPCVAFCCCALLCIAGIPSMCVSCIS